MIALAFGLFAYPLFLLWATINVSPRGLVDKTSRWSRVRRAGKAVS